MSYLGKKVYIIKVNEKMFLIHYIKMFIIKFTNYYSYDKKIYVSSSLIVKILQKNM